MFGTAEEMKESIFKRIDRVDLQQKGGKRKSAIIDTGDPRRWYGKEATTALSARDDEDVVKLTTRCVTGDDDFALPAHDFVYARLQSLADIRGFNTNQDSKKKLDLDSPLPDLVVDPPISELAERTAETVAKIKNVWESLPKCTAFVVFSGVGDPRGWRRCEELYKRWREEFKVKKWDELSVQWTDVEEQERKRELLRARRGCGFLMVK